MKENLVTGLFLVGVIIVFFACGVFGGIVAGQYAKEGAMEEMRNARFAVQMFDEFEKRCSPYGWDLSFGNATSSVSFECHGVVDSSKFKRFDFIQQKSVDDGREPTINFIDTNSGSTTEGDPVDMKG